MLAEGARDFHPYLSSTPTFDFQFECRRMSSRMVSREPEPCPMRECGRVDVRLGGCVGRARSQGGRPGRVTSDGGWVVSG